MRCDINHKAHPNHLGENLSVKFLSNTTKQLHTHKEIFMQIKFLKKTHTHIHTEKETQTNYLYLLFMYVRFFLLHIKTPPKERKYN